MKDYTKFRDWAALAKQGHPKLKDGYVFVGNGDQTTYLSEIFYSGNLLVWYGGQREWITGVGNGTNDVYCVPIVDWEKVTKLNYNEIMTDKKIVGSIRTKYNSNLAEIVKEILVQKGIAFQTAGHPEYLYRHSAGECGRGSESNLLDEWQDVSPGAFLSFLESLPDKVREVKGKLGPLEVVVTPDLVKIGCKQLLPDEFKKLKEIVTEKREVIKFKTEQGMTIEISNTTIKSGDGRDGSIFSFEDFNQVDKMVSRLE